MAKAMQRAIRALEGAYGSLWAAPMEVLLSLRAAGDTGDAAIVRKWTADFEAAAF